MAGEELKAPGVNYLANGNPLYNRGLPRTEKEKERNLVHDTMIITWTVLFTLVLFLFVVLLVATPFLFLI